MRPSLEAKILRPSLDKSTYLVEDRGVADDDDGTRYVVTDECHRHDEHGVLVR